jgi:hypothetical protein
MPWGWVDLALAVVLRFEVHVMLMYFNISQSLFVKCIFNSLPQGSGN